MTFENTVQYLLDFMSGECKNRDEALKFLFLTENNGFYWKDGELVNDWLNSTAIRCPLKNKNKPAKERIDSISAFNTKDDILKLRLEFYMDKSKKILDAGEIEKMYVIVKEIKNKIFSYPSDSKNIFINNYPDDINPDWLNAINEYKNRISEIVDELNRKYPIGG